MQLAEKYNLNLNALRVFKPTIRLLDDQAQQQVVEILKARFIKLVDANTTEFNRVSVDIQAVALNSDSSSEMGYSGGLISLKGGKDALYYLHLICMDTTVFIVDILDNNLASLVEDSITNYIIAGRLAQDKPKFH